VAPPPAWKLHGLQVRLLARSCCILHPLAGADFGARFGVLQRGSFIEREQKLGRRVWIYFQDMLHNQECLQVAHKN
jgi:hypothetical protein